jgi:hypothetical protein
METVSKGEANIIVAQLGPEVGVLIDDLVKLGLRDKVQIVFPYFVQGGSGIATAKPKKGAEGIICGFPQAQPNFLEHGEFPGLDVVINFQKKIRGWAEISPYFYYGGWACVYVALKAAELAAEKVGVENLSGAAIHEALERIDIKGADTHGVFRIIKGSPTERSLSDSAILTEWDPKKELFTPVTGWTVMPKMREWLKAHPEAK